jgi:hypothetical protein
VVVPTQLWSWASAITRTVKVVTSEVKLVPALGVTVSQGSLEVAVHSKRVLPLGLKLLKSVAVFSSVSAWVAGSGPPSAQANDRAGVERLIVPGGPLLSPPQLGRRLKAATTSHGLRPRTGMGFIPLPQEYRRTSSSR